MPPFFVSSQESDLPETRDSHNEQLEGITFAQPPEDVPRYTKVTEDEPQPQFSGSHEMATASNQPRQQRLLVSVGEGSSKTDKRHLKSLAQEAEGAVEAAASRYGLHVSILYLRDERDRWHGIEYNTERPADVYLNVKKPFLAKYKDTAKLLELDRCRTRETAVLLDKHLVSKTFWKEMAALFSVPSWRFIQEVQESLESRLEMQRTPGAAPGAYLSFAEELRFAILDICKREGKSLAELIHEQVMVKIEGDGCRVSRTVSWTTILFVLIRHTSKGLQDPNLHRTLLVAQNEEAYFAIRETCGPLFNEINQVAERGGLEVDGRFFPLTLCLGGDLKFLLLVFGMKGASSNFGCPFCLANKHEWSDDTLSGAYFNGAALVRTQDNLRTHAENLMFGVQYVPLIRIEPKLTFPDTMHMRVRVLDRLLDNVLQEFEDMDSKEGVVTGVTTTSHVDQFVQLVRQCGVQLHVLKDASHKGRTFTALTGNESKTLPASRENEEPFARRHSRRRHFAVGNAAVSFGDLEQ
ncbi:hypothetical protein HPB52_007376 [Rhipicephalus sanguineus]|uniref:Uncharacterized protein n=1 Tax=Rhipicephalus sanguineus TaxID=34632 RepID=A0A9D4SNW2_RHISA|nr:hypothetical protein HPB52_007376 [Rhipicephalus sanguineus]